VQAPRDSAHLGSFLGEPMKITRMTQAELLDFLNKEVAVRYGKPTHIQLYGVIPLEIQKQNGTVFKVTEYLVCHSDNR
jgi:hypothetical protein